MLEAVGGKAAHHIIGARSGGIIIARGFGIILREGRMVRCNTEDDEQDGDVARGSGFCITR